jgi:predicted metal-dependent enzyme (double-stranded beta helix superfamily)
MGFVQKPETDVAPLRSAVHAFSRLVTGARSEAEILVEGSQILAHLLARDIWLPEAFAQPSPERYSQYLLHCDSEERFSIVSFVWGPGQQTPVHNHTVWGLVGVLRGAERAQRYAIHEGALVLDGEETLLERGGVEAISPTIGDIHKVSNAYSDQVSISIHVYGANIGAVRRSTFSPDGAAKTFISGYSSSLLPNLWDRSAESRTSA